MEREVVIVRTTVTEADHIAAAQAEHAAFIRQHPDGWATTPKRSIQAMTAIRHREITVGRTLTEPERDTYLRSLCDASR